MEGSNATRREEEHEIFGRPRNSKTNSKRATGRSSSGKWGAGGGRSLQRTMGWAVWGGGPISVKPHTPRLRPQASAGCKEPQLRLQDTLNDKTLTRRCGFRLLPVGTYLDISSRLFCLLRHSQAVQACEARSPPAAVGQSYGSI